MTTPIEKRGLSQSESRLTNDLICSLKSLISDIPEPLFIADSESETILLLNNSAMERLFGFNPTGLPLGDVLDRDALSGQSNHLYFSNRWYTLEKKSFDLLGDRYLKILLREKAGLPGPESIKAMQNMISVLLHRFRSPLTGMMGFVDILNLDARDSRSEKHLSNLESGIDYLYEMLDELEYFLQLDSLSHRSHFDPAEMVSGILSGFTDEVKGRVTVENDEQQYFFSCRKKVSKILSLLIDNAIRHSEHDSDITVSIESPSSVFVTNHGYEISQEEQEWIFEPFTTSAADRMGNGLPLAQILAASIGASVDLVTGQESTTFILMLPPGSKGSNSG